MSGSVVGGDFRRLVDAIAYLEGGQTPPLAAGPAGPERPMAFVRVYVHCEGLDEVEERLIEVIDAGEHPDAERWLKDFRALREAGLL